LKRRRRVFAGPRRPLGEEERADGGGSDGQPEGADDAVHGLVLPPHGAAPVSRAVPEAGTGRV